MNQTVARDTVSCQLIRHRNLVDQLVPRGFYTFEHSRGGVVLARQLFCPNVVMVEGKHFMLSTTFKNETNLATWYIGLISDVDFTAIDEDDTYDDIGQSGNLWKEFTNYDYSASSVNRGTWTIGNPPSGKQLTSSAQTQFDVTGAGGTIKGAFICAGASAITKGDHANVDEILFSASLLSGGDVAVVSSDVFKVTYTITT